LVYDASTQKVRIPETVHQTWGMSREFGKAYEELLEEARNELKYDTRIQTTSEKDKVWGEHFRSSPKNECDRGVSRGLSLVNKRCPPENKQMPKQLPY
jgi:hypothetical protein